MLLNTSKFLTPNNIFLEKLKWISLVQCYSLLGVFDDINLSYLDTFDRLKHQGEDAQILGTKKGNEKPKLQGNPKNCMSTMSKIFLTYSFE